MVSAGGIGGCVTVTRILVNQGRPMYNIDARSLQVKQCFVLSICSICCTCYARTLESLIRNFVLCPTYFLYIFLNILFYLVYFYSVKW